jgi:hypothetical protein
MPYKNKEDAKANKRAWYQKNKDRMKEIQKTWEVENKEHRKSQGKQYYNENKERILKHQQAYRKANYNKWLERAKLKGYAVWRWSVEYQQWKRDVYTRDNHTCKDCGKTHCKVNAHHIKSAAEYPELRYDVSNGICLCVECHKSRHTNSG